MSSRRILGLLYRIPPIKSSRNRSEKRRRFLRRRFRAVVHLSDNIIRTERSTSTITFNCFRIHNIILFVGLNFNLLFLLQRRRRLVKPAANVRRRQDVVDLRAVLGQRFVQLYPLFQLYILLKRTQYKDCGNSPNRDVKTLPNLGSVCLAS